MTHHDIVKKLIGPIEPLGDASRDYDRLENLEQMAVLVELLISDIEKVSQRILCVKYDSIPERDLDVFNWWCWEGRPEPSESNTTPSLPTEDGEKGCPFDEVAFNPDIPAANKSEAVDSPIVDKPAPIVIEGKDEAAEKYQSGFFPRSPSPEIVQKVFKDGWDAASTSNALLLEKAMAFIRSVHQPARFCYSEDEKIAGDLLNQYNESLKQTK